MFKFNEWKVDRFVRAIVGLGLGIYSIFGKSNNSLILGVVSVVMIFTALSNACPFNACAVKIPVKREDR